MPGGSGGSDAVEFGGGHSTSFCVLQPIAKTNHRTKNIPPKDRTAIRHVPLVLAMSQSLWKRQFNPKNKTELRTKNGYENDRFRTGEKEWDKWDGIFAPVKLGY
jgi:hypothetical protein